jgi:hypothetical protein
MQELLPECRLDPSVANYRPSTSLYICSGVAWSVLEYITGVHVRTVHSYVV